MSEWIIKAPLPCTTHYLFWSLTIEAANEEAGHPQQLHFERSCIFARIDSKVEDPQLICCILSSLGQNSLCMYMIAVLCGGSNGAGLFIRCSLLGVSQLLWKDTPFLRHMLTQQAVLSRGDWALWRIWFFEKKILIFLFCQGQSQVQAQAGFQAQPCFQQVQVHVIHGYSIFW